MFLPFIAPTSWPDSPKACPSRPAQGQEISLVTLECKEVGLDKARGTVCTWNVHGSVAILELGEGAALKGSVLHCQAGGREG